MKDKMLVNIGECYIVFNIFLQGYREDGAANSTLRLKVYNASNYCQIYDYNMEQMGGGKRKLKVGRTPACDIAINDNLLSKVQCQISLQ